VGRWFEEIPPFWPTLTQCFDAVKGAASRMRFPLCPPIALNDVRPGRPWPRPPAPGPAGWDEGEGAWEEERRWLSWRAVLFDNLVGEQLHLVGNGQAERLRSLKIDHELEFGRLQDRQRLLSPRAVLAATK
jgi:hypothetical protein